MILINNISANPTPTYHNSNSKSKIPLRPLLITFYRPSTHAPIMSTQNQYPLSSPLKITHTHAPTSHARTHQLQILWGQHTLCWNREKMFFWILCLDGDVYLSIVANRKNGRRADLLLMKNCSRDIA